MSQWSTRPPGPALSLSLPVSIPAPRTGLAIGGSAVVAVIAALVGWEPWRGNTTLLADGWGALASWLCAVLWVAAPLVALRRPAPASAACLLPLLVTASDAERGWPISLFAALVAVAAVAIWDDLREGALLGAVALLPVVTMVAGLTRLQLPFETSIEGVQRPVVLVMYAVVVALGLALVRRWRSGADAREGLRRRSAVVEQESAVLAERARLARDLHDVVAHHVSLIAVRAETAPYTISDLTPSARVVLGEIADDSRRALDELRGVLGVLRRAAEDPLLAPQPGAADIALLVDQAWTAGEQVEWTPRDLTHVDDAIGYAGYRVVQELLTNARRHAPGVPMALETEPLPGGGLWVRSANRAGESGQVVPGRGLTGMAERVHALGGTLDADWVDGIFVVEAALPARAPALDSPGSPGSLGSLGSPG